MPLRWHQVLPQSVARPRGGGHGRLDDRQLSPWSWSAWRNFSLSAADEALTENFCTNNENVEQFPKLAEQERQKQQGR